MVPFLGVWSRFEGEKSRVLLCFVRFHWGPREEVGVRAGCTDLAFGRHGKPGDGNKAHGK